jgi:Domain of unknown function (DUF4173)
VTQQPPRLADASSPTPFAEYASAPTPIRAAAAAPERTAAVDLAPPSPPLLGPPDGPGPGFPAGPVRPPSGPDPAPPARGVFSAVLVAAAVGALALPAWRVGLGWLISLAAVAGAILVARSARRTADGGGSGTQPRRSETGADRAWRIAAAVAATALVAVAGIRSAGWLVAICLIAGALLGSYAMAGGRSWGRVLRGFFALAPASALALGWAATRPEPSGSRPSSTAERREGQHPARVVAGVLVGLVLLAVFGALFRSADPAFARLTGSMVDGLSPRSLVRAALGFVIVGVIALGATYLTANPPEAEPRQRAGTAGPAGTEGRRRLGLAEWVIPLAMLDALFALFVWVQITVLFAGNDFVLAPGGPDYAVHARGGSFQLGVVTALTLGVLAVLAVWAGRSSRLELGLLRLLGGVLCGLTLVIVASALFRLNLYAQAYGFTVPRVLAYAVQVWLGLIVLLVLAAGVRLRATWLPRTVVAAAVAVLIGLVAVNPDAVIARTVLSRIDGPYPVDYAYLSTLSPDAVDVLAPTSLVTRNCPWHPIDLSTPDPWYAYNYARAHARDVLKQHPRAGSYCP